MSICSATVPPSGFCGSKAIWASNFLNTPSTGTPICLLTKAIWLCRARASRIGSAPALAEASDGDHGGGARAQRRRQAHRVDVLALRGPHAIHQAVAVDEVVLERGRRVQQHHRGQREGAALVQRLQHCLGEFLVDRHEVRQRQHAEPDDRKAQRRAVGPAEQRHGEEQHVQQQVRAAVRRQLPARHRLHDARRQRRRRVRQAPQQAQRRQHQDRDAGPLVPVVELEPHRRERQARSCRGRR